MRSAHILAAGLALGVVSMLLTHPLAVVLSLSLSLSLAHRSGATARAPWLTKLALGIAISFALLNGAFSWTGETVLWRAPFRVALMGRPLLTLEAIVWGAVAGAQLAATTLAIGAATIAVPPESLHRALLVARVPWPLAAAAGLGLRLVSDTSRDARAMAQALRVRGASTAGVRGSARVLVPLTARSLDRAFVAEEALVMRGYGSHVAREAPPRFAVLTLAGITVAGLVAFLGPGRPPYYPRVDASLGPLDLLLLLAALTIPAFLVWRVRP